MGLLDSFRKRDSAAPQSHAEQMYEDYKEYMQHQDENGQGIMLTARGWTRLIHELLDTPIKEDFGLYPVKERCWASEYDDGRRKVISGFPVNDMFSTIQWGWNFFYIPRTTGGKKVWARTDKSIYAHTFRLSEEFYTGVEKGKKRKSVFGRASFRKPEEFRRVIDEIETAYHFVKLDIKAYFDKTHTYEGMLSELEDICHNKYYRFLHPDNRLVYIGVEAYMGKTEKARKDLDETEFSSEEDKTGFAKRIALSEKVNASEP